MAVGFFSVPINLMTWLYNYFGIFLILHVKTVAFDTVDEVTVLFVGVISNNEIL